MIGGGIELALACDIRVAADDIQFGFFHMRRGMHFGDGGIVRLVNTCGVGIAMELELMGEPVTAQRAKEFHLVNRVVPRDQLMATVEDIAAKILRNPRAAVESAKDTILEVVGRPLDDQLRLECLYSYSTMGDPEIITRKDEFLAAARRRPAQRPAADGAAIRERGRRPLRSQPDAQLWDGKPGLTGTAGPPPAAARADERRGLDHVMLGDHVMFQGGLGNDGLIDTASALTANEELGVYLAVYLLVLRHPLLVARQLLTVAQLAPGRLSLGVGIAGDDRRGGRRLRRRPAHPRPADGRGARCCGRCSPGRRSASTASSSPSSGPPCGPSPSCPSR